LAHSVTEACSTVGTGDYWDKWISLLEVAEVILFSDLLPGKAVSFAQSELFEVRMNVYFMLL
jgi:hypothetical protein